mmetsp:Transcript_103490/g.178319  ORF Transcript_103490/g.178319 Transcript_103490/m.178319 type:complete len:205 (-) Transcript_103490:3348-3962(-)
MTGSACHIRRTMHLTLCCSAPFQTGMALPRPSRSTSGPASTRTLWTIACPTKWYSLRQATSRWFAPPCTAAGPHWLLSPLCSSGPSSWTRMTPPPLPRGWSVSSMKKALSTSPPLRWAMKRTRCTSRGTLAWLCPRHTRPGLRQRAAARPSCQLQTCTHGSTPQGCSMAPSSRPCVRCGLGMARLLRHCPLPPDGGRSSACPRG